MGRRKMTNEEKIKHMEEKVAEWEKLIPLLWRACNGEVNDCAERAAKFGMKISQANDRYWELRQNVKCYRYQINKLKREGEDNAG